jgi:PadR family transcriptional regulator AphA
VPTIAEHVCLVLVTQGVTHGWAIGTLLAPDGELGRIWTLSRPLTYRAIDGLVERGLVRRHGTVVGAGRDRTVLEATAAGRQAAAAWLDEPVAHVRSIRTELLLKLTLLTRAGRDIGPLIAAQDALLGPAIEALTTTGRDDDPVDLWRRESARAARRFLATALDARHQTANTPDPDREARSEMRLSARNQLRATIETVTHGEVMSTIKVVLPDGQHLTAAITKDAAVDLDLARGDDVLVIIKSTEVMVGRV